MGKRNYLIEGVSGTGKTSVCHELRRRGYHAINGDRELRAHNPPTPDQQTERITALSDADTAEIRRASNHWDIAKVRSAAANQDDQFSFFCGGSRNFQ
jgi:broad-specificity NMP kinase